MVGLRLATDLLEVDELEDVRTGEDVVTPTRSPELEPERLDKPPHVGERDVREIPASDARQESPRIHDATLAVNPMPRLGPANPVGGISVLPLEPIWLE